jgi:hypothetical protein
VYIGLRAPEVQKTETLLRQLPWAPIEWEAARLAGDLKREWGSQRKNAFSDPHADCGSLPYRGLTLVTDNHKHFPMPELSLYPLP